MWLKRNFQANSTCNLGQRAKRAHKRTFHSGLSTRPRSKSPRKRDLPCSHSEQHAVDFIKHIFSPPRTKGNIAEKTIRATAGD